MNDISKITVPKGLLEANPVYKPFRYPWAYEAWLTQQRVHWLPEEVPLADDVKDWHKNLTEGERNLVTQIFRFFTQADVEVNNCYDASTEVLTSKGWVAFPDLQKGTAVVQVNSDRQSSFVLPTAYHAHHHTGPMVRISNELDTVDLCVTGDHDLVYSWKDDQQLLKSSAVGAPVTSRLYRHHTAARLANESVDDQGSYTPSEEHGDGSLLTRPTTATRTLSATERLLIAFQADGRKLPLDGSRSDHYTMRFRFKKDRKVRRLHSIIEDGNFESHTTTGPDGVTEIAVRFPGAYPGDSFSWIDLSRISGAWCDDFIAEIAHWDACIAGNGTQYRTTRKDAADMVCAILALAGNSGKVTDNTDYASPHWLVSSCPYRPVQGTLLKKEITHVTDYPVYCVTVPEGRLLVRRNGVVSVCGNCYMKHYSQVFKPTEVLMMLSAFSNIETIHVAAYSHLLDTIGMPDSEYSAFLEYKEMKDKYDYMQSFTVENKHEIAKTLAAFGAFTEGLQLFASFAILLNFPRFGKMKGMGQVVTWSVRDETLHCLSVIRLFRTFIQENPEIWTETLKQELRDICTTIVEHEDAFVDLAFSMGPVDGLSAAEVKAYIRFIADRRLTQLGLDPLFGSTKNPLMWIDEILSAPEHANFFEARGTEYSKAATGGSWGDTDVWEASMDRKTFGAELEQFSGPA